MFQSFILIGFLLSESLRIMSRTVSKSGDPVPWLRCSPVAAILESLPGTSESIEHGSFAGIFYSIAVNTVNQLSVVRAFQNHRRLFDCDPLLVAAFQVFSSVGVHQNICRAQASSKLTASARLCNRSPRRSQRAQSVLFSFHFSGMGHSAFWSVTMKTKPTRLCVQWFIVRSANHPPLCVLGALCGESCLPAEGLPDNFAQRDL
jgi:hypothetical protein